LFGVYVGIGTPQQPQEEHKNHDKENEKEDEYENYPSYTGLKIPPGHLPPPGMCKIWYPGRPPGHQPPPTSCESAFKNVPSGAWVIRRKDDNHELLEVNETGNKPRIIVDIKIYLIN